MHQLADANNMISQAFENTSTSVAASQMRNALNTLVDTCDDQSEKKVRIMQEEEEDGRNLYEHSF